MELTQQQKDVVACNEREFLVSACAGSGKTSVLVAYAKARPNETMTYLAFNRAIKEEAERKFPKNVRCVTTHGMAFGRFGKYFQNKLGNARAYHVSSALELPMATAGVILNSAMRFLASDDMEINEKHVQPDLIDMSKAAEAVTLTKKLWGMMQDVANAGVPMPHDGYLKLFHLAKAQVNTEVILFDECQDANPVVLSIVANQPGRKVFVGDSRQSIYAFRGAHNTIDTMRVGTHLKLTNSFRFGDGVAMFANAVLGQFQKHDAPISGLGKHKTVFAVDRTRPHTVLCRTNGMLFMEAVSAINSGTPFGFVGGVQHYRFENVLDAYWLRKGQRGNIKDKFIQSFGDFAEMLAYAEALDDRELKFLVRVVNDYGDAIPDLVKQIQEKAVPLETAREGVVAMTTGHRAKGLEWLDVVITEDFTDMTAHFDPKKEKEVEPDTQEINLLYVAATRAQRGLQLPATLVAWAAEHHPQLALVIRERNAPANSDMPPLAHANEPKNTVADKRPVNDVAEVPKGFVELARSVVASPMKRGEKLPRELQQLACQLAGESTECQRGNPERASHLALLSGLVAMVANGEVQLAEKAR